VHRARAVAPEWSRLRKGMWWAKGVLGTVLVVTGFLVTQPSIMGRLSEVLGLP